MRGWAPALCIAITATACGGDQWPTWVSPYSDGGVAGGTLTGADAGAASDMINGSAPDADGGTADGPAIKRIMPLELTPGGMIYVLGSGLGQRTDAVSGGVSAHLEYDVAGASKRIDLAIFDLADNRLTTTLPASAKGMINGPARLVINTRGQTLQAKDTLTVTATNSFSQPTTPGLGAAGYMVRMQPNSRYLPNFTVDVCADPSVINQPPAQPCPLKQLLMPNFDIPNRLPTAKPALNPGEWFAVRFESKLMVTAAGMYGFKVCSDDGAKLYIDGAQIIGDDSIHAVTCVANNVTLGLGPHNFAIEYMNGFYLMALQIYWTPPGGKEVIIPPGSFQLPF